MQNNNTIDDAAFDEILKQHNIQAPATTSGSGWDAITGLEEKKGFLGRVGERITKGQEEINKEYQTKDAGIGMRESAGAQGKGSSNFQKFANNAKAGVSSIVSPVTSFIEEAISTGRAHQKEMDDQAIAEGRLKPEEALSNQPHFEDQLASLAKTMFGALSKNREDNKAKLSSEGKESKDVIDMFNEASPATKANLGAVKDLGMAAFDAGTALEGGKLIKKGVEKAIEKAPAAVDTLVDSAKAAKDIPSKVKKIGATKTPDELRAMKPEEVKKLSLDEQQKYYADKVNQINQQAKADKLKVKKEAAAQSQKDAEQIQQLSKEVDNVAADKTIELKPKVVEAFSKQSKKFGDIVEKEIAPVRDMPIAGEDVKKSLDELFTNNPGKAEEYMDKLGLKTKVNKETGEITIDATKVGDLYEKTRELRQGISKSAKGGARTYTPAEYELDSVVSKLNDILGQKGVDLTEANNFWKSWAPVRDKLNTTVRPFDLSDTRGEGFAKLLRKVAADKGDTFNKNFIAQVEDVLGEPVTKETKSAMAKLTQAQKDKIAKEVEAAEKQIDIDLQKNATKQQLSDQKYLDNMKAKKRTEFKKKVAAILVGAGILSGGTKVGYDVLTN